MFVALRLFLTLPVTNCEGERSFSQMARIKNELRTSMCQKRLSALLLMAIESELVRELDFDDVVTKFSRTKSRGRCSKVRGIFIIITCWYVRFNYIYRLCAVHFSLAAIAY